MSDAKTITRIAPASHGLEESERHYVAVHVQLARRLLPRQASMLAYSTLRVLRQRDAAGGWHRRPEAWRFIVLRFDDAQDTVFPEDTRRRTADDHRNCLRDLRRTNVDEDVRLDRLCGQTALQSYLIEIDRREAGEDPRAEIEAVVSALVGAGGRVGGLRRVTYNKVLSETETEALDEPGQLLTSRLLEDTDKLAYVEVVVDDAHFGRELFADAAVETAVLACERVARCRVYEVDEACGFDRRPLT
jgi:hypothetical protein